MDMYTVFFFIVLMKTNNTKAGSGIRRSKDNLQNMKESTIIKMKCFELKESLGVDWYGFQKRA